MPYSDPVQPQLPFEVDEGIKTPLLPVVDTDLLSNISDSYSEEEEYQHDFDFEFTPQRDIDLDPTSTSCQQPNGLNNSLKELGMVLGIQIIREE